MDIRPEENMASITCPYCHTTFPLAPSAPEKPAQTPEPLADTSEMTMMETAESVAASANPNVDATMVEPPLSGATYPPQGGGYAPPPVPPVMPAQPAYGQPAQPPYGQSAQPPYGQPAQPPYGQPAYGPQPFQPLQPEMMGMQQPAAKPRKRSFAWLWILLTFLVMAASFLFVMSKTDTGLGRSIRQLLGMRDPFRVETSYHPSSSSNQVDESPIDILDEEDEEDDYVDYNGHDAVDMGLSVDWADMNVGASDDYDYGSLYEWSSSVASNEWGGDWRMPTPAEFQELIDNCSTYSDWNGGNYGMYFTSNITSNTIFLPYSGFCNRNSDERINYDRTGHYWTSVLDSDDSKARNMSIGDATGAYLGQHDRFSRQAIRPVIRKSTD